MPHRLGWAKVHRQRFSRLRPHRARLSRLEVYRLKLYGPETGVGVGVGGQVKLYTLLRIVKNFENRPCYPKGHL